MDPQYKNQVALIQARQAALSKIYKATEIWFRDRSFEASGARRKTLELLAVEHPGGDMDPDTEKWLHGAAIRAAKQCSLHELRQSLRGVFEAEARALESELLKLNQGLED